MSTRQSAGTPAGGQFAATAHTETGTLLTQTPQDPARFGPNSVHVQELLDRAAAMTPQERATLAAHAPAVTSSGTEMFCPNADALSYGSLGRYRRLSRAAHGNGTRGPLHDEVGVALVEATAAGDSLPTASADAVTDAVVALVSRDRMHAVAYDTLTRAVRRALGPVHPDDTQLHR